MFDDGFAPVATTLDAADPVGGGADGAAAGGLLPGGLAAITAAVALNAGATLYISGQAANIKDGYVRALAAIGDGSVTRKIEEVREASCA